MCEGPKNVSFKHTYTHLPFTKSPVRRKVLCSIVLPKTPALGIQVFYYGTKVARDEEAQVQGGDTCSPKHVVSSMQDLGV